MRSLFILNGPTYGSEESYNALRLAGSLVKWEGRRFGCASWARV